MNAFTQYIAPDRGQSARALILMDSAGLDDWLKGLPARARTAATAQRFLGLSGEVAILPGDGADDWSVAVGVEDRGSPGVWSLAKAAETLPEGHYRLDTPPGPALHGWLLAQHRFDRYRRPDSPVSQ